MGRPYTSEVGDNIKCTVIYVILKLIFTLQLRMQLNFVVAINLCIAKSTITRHYFTNTPRTKQPNHRITKSPNRVFSFLLPTRVGIAVAYCNNVYPYGYVHRVLILE